MGVFDDLIRNVVKEELSKAPQGAPDKPDAAGGKGTAQPGEAAAETGSVNKATETEKTGSVNKSAETGKADPSAVTNETADTITIKSSDLKDILAQAVREGNAAALNGRVAGATSEQPDPLKSMAKLCGLVKEKE